MSAKKKSSRSKKSRLKKSPKILVTSTKFGYFLPTFIFTNKVHLFIIITWAFCKFYLRILKNAQWLRTGTSSTQDAFSFR